MSTRYNDGSHYENHQRAAELHDERRARPSGSRAEGQDQEHLTGSEHSRQALEHSEEAHQQSPDGYRRRTASPRSGTMTSRLGP